MQRKNKKQVFPCSLTSSSLCNWFERDEVERICLREQNDLEKKVGLKTLDHDKEVIAPFQNEPMLKIEYLLLTYSRQRVLTCFFRVNKINSLLTD